MEPDKNLQKKTGLVLGIIVMLTVFAITIFADRKPAVTPVTDTEQNATDIPDTTTQNTPAPASVPIKKVVSTSPIDTTKKSTSVYKDGTYTATGSYMSPGGEDQVSVTLTLKKDIITYVSVIPEASDNTSNRYENKFVSGYKTYVLGKNIADVNLGKISGSSLTPIGFNNAIAQIKAEAKA